MAAIQTLKSLRDQVLYWLDEAGDTGTTKQNVDNAINQAYQNRCAKSKWPWLLWPVTETFTTVAGQQQYSLHQEFWRPLYFRSRGTYAQFLVETPFDSLVSAGVDWNQSDTAYANKFIFKGISPIQNQPTAASVVTLVSNSTSDTAVTFTVKGDTANGVVSEIMTSNGTTTVTSVNTFTRLLNVTKSTSTVGTVTLKSNAGAVTNLTLLSGEFARSYRQLYLLNAPEAGEVIEYQFIMQPDLLSADYDVPLIPPPFGQILVWDTLLLFAGYNTDLSDKSISVWRDMRQQIETNMYNTFADQQTLGAEAKFINFNPLEAV